MTVHHTDAIALMGRNVPTVINYLPYLTSACLWPTAVIRDGQSVENNKRIGSSETPTTSSSSAACKRSGNLLQRSISGTSYPLACSEDQPQQLSQHQSSMTWTAGSAMSRGWRTSDSLQEVAAPEKWSQWPDIMLERSLGEFQVLLIVFAACLTQWCHAGLAIHVAAICY